MHLSLFFICLTVLLCLSVCLTVSMCLSICLTVYLSICLTVSAIVCLTNTLIVSLRTNYQFLPDNTGLTFYCAIQNDEVRVYSDRTRQRQNDGVKHNSLELEHMFVNRSIQTGRVASGLRGNPKDVDFFVMQEVSRRAVSSTTLRFLC